jgi:hypothetical protein
MEVEEMLKRLALLVFLGISIAAPVRAAETHQVQTGYGPRVGFSTGPDQLVFGGQLIIGEIAPNITFDPSLEFGFGDHQTVICTNFDLHYHFDVSSSSWRPYAGAGVAINFVTFDSEEFGNKDSETDVGGSLIVGAGVPTKSGNRFFGELKLGIGDNADLKMMVGWNFKM